MLSETVRPARLPTSPWIAKLSVTLICDVRTPLLTGPIGGFTAYGMATGTEVAENLSDVVGPLETPLRASTPALRFVSSGVPADGLAGFGVTERMLGLRVTL